jgi:hypothetical protein
MSASGSPVIWSKSGKQQSPCSAAFCSRSGTPDSRGHRPKAAFTDAVRCHRAPGGFAGAANQPPPVAAGLSATCSSLGSWPVPSPGLGGLPWPVCGGTRRDAGGRREVARFVEDMLQAGVDQVRVGVESPEARNDACCEPSPAVVEAGDLRPLSCTKGVRDSSCERVEVERGEVRNLLPHSAHLEARGRADRDEPGR